MLGIDMGRILTQICLPDEVNCACRQSQAGVVGRLRRRKNTEMIPRLFVIQFEMESSFPGEERGVTHSSGLATKSQPMAMQTGTAKNHMDSDVMPSPMKPIARPRAAQASSSNKRRANEGRAAAARCCGKAERSGGDGRWLDGMNFIKRDLTGLKQNWLRGRPSYFTGASFLPVNISSMPLPLQSIAPNQASA